MAVTVLRIYRQEHTSRAAWATEPTDLKIGILFCTRVPLFHAASIGSGDVAAAIWAFPIAGALVGGIGAALWPRARKAMERFAKRHVQSIKDHTEAENKKIHDRLAHHEDLLHHVIKHSIGVPPFEEEEKESWTKPPAQAQALDAVMKTLHSI